MKFRVFLLAAIALLLYACAAQGASSPLEQPASGAPTSYPDTPAPPKIDAPVVASPALVTVHFLNELDGWGVTETQIVRTNDGGLTWYNVTPAAVTETGYGVDLFVFDATHAWMQKQNFGGDPNNGSLNVTSDGGLTWRTLPVPFGAARLHFLDAGNGWALADLGAGAGSNAVAVYQTTDGGATWSRTYTNDPNQPDAGKSLPLGGIKSDLIPLNMQTAWVTGVTYTSGSIYLYRTDDGGSTWSPVSLPVPQGAENFQMGVDRDAMKFVTASDGYLAVRVAGDTTQTAVYVTRDAGATWTLTPTLIPEGGEADFLSAEEAVIYNGAQFYVTRDAARTWSIIPPNVVFGDSFDSLDFVNALSGWVITLDPTGHRTLYRTHDGGATWSPVLP